MTGDGGREFSSWIAKWENFLCRMNYLNDERNSNQILPKKLVKIQPDLESKNSVILVKT